MTQISCGLKADIVSTVKGSVFPRRRPEGPKQEDKYSTTISLTSVLDGSVWSTTDRAASLPGQEIRN